METRRYDSTVARIAGNILGGYVGNVVPQDAEAEAIAVRWSVKLARAIVAEVERTEPVGALIAAEIDRLTRASAPRSNEATTPHRSRRAVDESSS